MSSTQGKKLIQDTAPDLLRVVVITPSFFPAIGGVETHVAETVVGLLSQGSKVMVVTAGTCNQTQVIAFHGFSLTVVTIAFPQRPIIGLLAIWWRMVRLLPLFLHSDIIHIHDVLWWFFPVRLLLPFSRVVLTMHGWEGVFPIPLKLRMIKQLSALAADKVLLVGEFIAKYYGVVGDALTYGAVNQLLVSRAVPYQEKSQLNPHVSATAKPVVAYAGRLAGDTGFAEVIAAARHQSAVQWQFYGDGPGREAAAIVGEVYGWTNQRVWLQTADIVIASGYLSVWECLAAGKLVIVIATNQLKRDYFQLSPFADHIRVVTNAKELEVAIHELLQLPVAQKQQIEARGIHLAHTQTWSQIDTLYQYWYRELQVLSIYKRLRGRFMHIRWGVEHVKLAVFGCLAVYFGSLLVSLLLMLGSIWMVRADFARSDLQSLQGHSQVGQQAAAAFNMLTLHAAKPVLAMHSGFTLISQIASVQSGAEELLSDPEKPQPTRYAELASTISQLPLTLGDIDQVVCHKNQLASRFELVGEFCTMSAAIGHNWQPLSQLLAYWLGGERKLLVLLQNTQELRATGGFMGSYALVDFTGQTLPRYSLGDIYEPDGQFQGYVSAPAGVDEFLSSGRGLRLPDANWQPDFPSSAETILQYFAFGRQHGLDGVVTINMSFMEQILRIVGPVYLPDYKIEVTATNLADVARADRQNFFPGSIQKQHFLLALTNQVKFMLAHLDRTQKLELVNALLMGLQRKEIQLYQVDSQLQQQADILRWTGRQSTLASSMPSGTPPAGNDIPLYLMVVESNVGINKANRAIDRSVLIDVRPEQLQVQLRLKNNNTSPLQTAGTESINGMGYVNYQRLFFSPDLIVRTIELEGKKIPTWHEQLITTQAGEVFNQVGFIFPIPQGQERTALISMQLKPDEITPSLVALPTLIDRKKIIIQRQSGLPETTYVLQTPSRIQQWSLTSDILLDL